MSGALDLVGTLMLLAGALLAVSAGIGLLRFPDVLSRMHSAAKPQALGLVLVLTGTALRLRTFGDLTTLVLVGAFQLLTVPVAAAMVGRAAYRAGEVDVSTLAEDSLAARLAAHADATTDPDDDGGSGTGDGGAADEAAGEDASSVDVGPDTDDPVDTAPAGTRRP